jgi:hypothetical protein
MNEQNKPDYSKLDAAILFAIRHECTSFYQLESAEMVKREARALAELSPKDRRGDRKPAFRFIDSRLQALRKRGTLSFDRKNGWQIAKVAA